MKDSSFIQYKEQVEPFDWTLNMDDKEPKEQPLSAAPQAIMNLAEQARLVSDPILFDEALV